jgi:hypothetical protein
MVPAEPHTAAPTEPTQEDVAGEVAAYLRAHPDFLAQRSDLYASLSPPIRVHGAIFEDHMAAMLAQARLRAKDMAASAQDVLAAGRAAGAIAERLQEAVLALIRATDPAECVTETWPGLLGIDAAALCCETIRPRWRTLPPGAVKALMRARPLVFRDRPADAALLHAEAALLAERDLLVQLPGAALLALVSRDGAALPNTQAWRFLGRALEARLEGGAGF